MTCAFRLVSCVMLSVFVLVCLPSSVSRFWLKNRQAGVYFVEGEGKIKEKHSLGVYVVVTAAVLDMK